MALNFFGLTAEYKKALHENIFSMVYWGKGGWTFNDLYTMPVYLRQFYLKSMVKAVEEEKQAMERK